MTSESEFNGNENTSETSTVSNQFIERASQGIEEYIKDVPLTSPRFQAFADYADLVDSEQTLLINRDSIASNIERALIQETIRQRKNGIMGYKKEYKECEEKALNLGQAISRKAETSGGENVTPLSPRLGNIKNRVIDQKSKTP